LKGLQAEYSALASLDPTVAATVTPLIQLWNRGTASDSEDPEGGDDEPHGAIGQQGMWGEPAGDLVWRRLKRQLLDKVKDRWLTSAPLLLDGGWLETASAFENVVRNCRASGRPVVPVTGIDRADGYQAVVARSIHREGAVLRLVRSDFEPAGSVRLKAAIDEVLERLGTEPVAVDVVLDLRYIREPYRERDELVAESMLRSIPYLRDWRNLAVAGSGIPPNAGGFNRDDITPRARNEWWLWQELRRRAHVVARVPVFGDYGVIHPEPVEQPTESRRLPRIPAIAYTAGDDFLMVRGIDLNRGDPQVVRDLFKRFMNVREWCGADFSVGDTWMARAAAGEINLGNWMSWKRAGESHHLTYVSRQLAM
jgi:hypothetical protein